VSKQIGSTAPRLRSHRHRPLKLILGLTQLICGDQRPKRFCPIFGGKASWPTRCSAWVRCFHGIIPSAFLARDHEQFYRPELGDKGRYRIIVQPMNRRIGVAIVVALPRIVQFDDLGRACAFLESLQARIPKALRFLEAMLTRLDLCRAYRQVRRADVSREVLALQPETITGSSRRGCMRLMPLHWWAGLHHLILSRGSCSERVGRRPYGSISDTKTAICLFRVRSVRCQRSIE
jgi:hypothetical protein